MVEPVSFFDAIGARIDGPMKFRFILQPAIALFFAIRDGRRDALDGKPPFFWAMFTQPGHRKDLMRSGWKSVGKVFIVAMILDAIFQFIAFKRLRPVGALLAGLILVVTPYLVLRGPVNRLLRKDRARANDSVGGAEA